MSLNGGSAINQALEMLNRLYPGETPSTAEYTSDLLTLNNMIDNWSLERINIPVIVVATANLTTGTAAYTCGASGTFGSTRFLRIEKAGILIPNAGLGSGTIRSEVKVIPESEFQQIEEKGAKAVRPTVLYYDYQYPVATLNLWPTPTFTTIAVQLELATWQALANFADTTTTVNTPLGFDRMLVLNLAVELAAKYSVAIPEGVAERANEAKAAFRAMNASNFQMPGQPPPSGPLNAIPPQAQAGA